MKSEPDTNAPSTAAGPLPAQKDSSTTGIDSPNPLPPWAATVNRLRVQRGMSPVSSHHPESTPTLPPGLRRLQPRIRNREEARILMDAEAIERPDNTESLHDLLGKVIGELDKRGQTRVPRPLAVRRSPVHVAPRDVERMWKGIDPANRERIREAITAGHWPLLFLGDVGTGKTCAALCVLDIAESGRYHTVEKACSEITAAQQGKLIYGQYEVSEAGWWRRWNEPECVCLDEIGSRERVSDHHYNVVKRTIDDRYNRPAIFISNLPLEGIASVYDDRIASRLASGTVVTFTGADRRITPSPHAATPPRG